MALYFYYSVLFFTSPYCLYVYVLAFGISALFFNFFPIHWCHIAVLIFFTLDTTICFFSDASKCFQKKNSTLPTLPADLSQGKVFLLQNNIVIVTKEDWKFEFNTLCSILSSLDAFYIWTDLELTNGWN